MLKAILEGKAGSVTVDGDCGEQSWRDVFRKREDLLTAVFFGRLRYLSEGGEQKVLALLVGDELAQSLGCIKEIVFWPKLKGLEGRRHVEPDVLLLFEHSLLLIEVKPPFGGMQHEEQWVAEVKSLIQQRDMDDAEIEIPEEFHFLALGRNTQDYQKAEENLRILCAEEGLASVNTHEWDEVCCGIHKFADNEQGRDRVIYRDWIDAFTLFGVIEPPLPFADLLKLKLQRMSILDHAFEVPMIKPSQCSASWHELTGLAKKIKLEVQQWK